MILKAYTDGVGVAGKNFLCDFFLYSCLPNGVRMQKLWPVEVGCQNLWPIEVCSKYVLCLLHSKVTITENFRTENLKWKKLDVPELLWQF